jgi:hypothetical protein
MEKLYIDLDDAGKIIGNRALMELAEGSYLVVRMDFDEQVGFEVPIEIALPVNVASSVDLGTEIDRLKTISMTVRGLSPTVTPQSVSSAP